VRTPGRSANHGSRAAVAKADLSREAYSFSGKQGIMRGPDLVLENKEHVALLFVMVVSRDRME
jgi:hypothetical protein